MKLHHLNSHPVHPTKVVVVGAGGFIGGSIANALRQDGVTTVAVSRNDIDFLDTRAVDKFRLVVNDAEALVIALAEAPCKTSSSLIRNIQMIEPILDVVQEMNDLHVVYISSDAVYADSEIELDEDSCCEPTSIHGIMHLAREIMLQSVIRTRLAIVRPTLVFGDEDPHNGYGPNRFKRNAEKGEPITLFGAGEELRDHIWIHDVSAIIRQVLYRKSIGVINAVTGEVMSFRDIASLIVASLRSTSRLEFSMRTTPIPHNGYRAFDNKLLCQAFPDITLTSLKKVYKTVR